MRRYSFEGNPAGRRAGCALVFIPALLGTAGLADYSGPGGWRGIAEFLGWWALCIAVAALIAWLFDRYDNRRSDRVVLGITIAAVAIGFAVLTYFAGAFGTPLAFKQTFTGFLQLAGVAAAVALILSVGYAVVRSKG